MQNPNKNPFALGVENASIHFSQKPCWCNDGCPSKEVCCGEKRPEEEQEKLLKELLLGV